MLTTWHGGLNTADTERQRDRQNKNVGTERQKSELQNADSMVLLLDRCVVFDDYTRKSNSQANCSRVPLKRNCRLETGHGLLH